jgi:indole-3-glycerol phosphate synthase
MDILGDFKKAIREKPNPSSEASLSALREQALIARRGVAPHRLRSEIGNQGRWNIIAEFRRFSPWQSSPPRMLPLAEMAQAYALGGAAAISIWTEETYFHGSLGDLQAARAAVPLPLLRKDLIFHPIQVYETAIAGADALLLIAEVLEDGRLMQLRRIAEEELGLDALIEVHSSFEMLRARALGATLISVNNRHYSSDRPSLNISVEVARSAPNDLMLVSEGGLRTEYHFRGLHALGFNGFLLSEPLLQNENPEKVLQLLMKFSKSR